MHVIDIPPGPGSFAGLSALSVHGAAGAGQPLQFIVSRASTAPNDQISLVLPQVNAVNGPGLQEIAAPDDAGRQQMATALKLTAARSLRVSEPFARLDNLTVPPGETLRLGVHYEATRAANRRQASRFSVVVKQGDQVLGGGTYILRPAGPTSPR